MLIYFEKKLDNAVHTNIQLKIKSRNGRTAGWPSGSLMTPVQFFILFLRNEMYIIRKGKKLGIQNFSSVTPLFCLELS